MTTKYDIIFWIGHWKKNYTGGNSGEIQIKCSLMNSIVPLLTYQFGNCSTVNVTCRKAGKGYAVIFAALGNFSLNLKLLQKKFKIKAY